VKERRRLARRIMKAVQPQLQEAAKAEAEVAGRSVELAIKEIEQLLEAAVVIGPDLTSTVSLTNGETRIDHDADTEMTEAGANEMEEVNGQRTSEVDLVQQDPDAPADIEMGDEPQELEGIPSPVAEVESKKSPSKSTKVNGIKNTATPPDSNGYVSAPESINPALQTPPISNGDTNNDSSDTLTQGGIPWFLKEFDPIGTSALPSNDDTASRASEELSEMDDEELRGLGGDIGEMDGLLAPVAPVVPIISPSKAKKGKAKKKGKSRR